MAVTTAGTVIFIIAFLPLHFCFEDHEIAGLDEHNKFRKHHGAPKMKLTKDLNEIGNKCAKYYVEKDLFDHSCPYKNGAGENLLKGGSGKTNNWTDWVVGATRAFYRECNYYDWEYPGYGNCGHFTQVIWKASTELGFGAFANKKSLIVVALYKEHGNMAYTCSFVKNVLEASCHSESAAVNFLYVNLLFFEAVIFIIWF
ncbi:unnamed protein product [Allacma fusca]|uniref:SCP domain-containing protein n=1 Tax=Allacma fusca TaxID=39272 RepID=A0A8J2KRZ9_9HEXA|nr:unnamed protein product [Allacma fusca]